MTLTKQHRTPTGTAQRLSGVVDLLARSGEVDNLTRTVTTPEQLDKELT